MVNEAHPDGGIGPCATSSPRCAMTVAAGLLPRRNCSPASMAPPAGQRARSCCARGNGPARGSVAGSVTKDPYDWLEVWEQLPCSVPQNEASRCRPLVLGVGILSRKHPAIRAWEDKVNELHDQAPGGARHRRSQTRHGVFCRHRAYRQNMRELRSPWLLGAPVSTSSTRKPKCSKNRGATRTVARCFSS